MRTTLLHATELWRMSYTSRTVSGYKTSQVSLENGFVERASVTPLTRSGFFNRSPAGLRSSANPSQRLGEVMESSCSVWTEFQNSNTVTIASAMNSLPRLRRPPCNVAPPILKRYSTFSHRVMQGTLCGTWRKPHATDSRFVCMNSNSLVPTLRWHELLLRSQL